MDRIITFLADDHSGASDVDTDIVWTVDNEMIISTIFGIVMNVILVDNSTGQNLTRAILLGKKIEMLKEQDTKEEKNQIIKNTIIGIHNDN